MLTRDYVWLIEPNGTLRMYKEEPGSQPNLWPDRWLLAPFVAEPLGGPLVLMGDAVASPGMDLNVVTPRGLRLSGRVLVVSVEPLTGQIVKLTGAEVAQLALVTRTGHPWPRYLQVLPCGETK